MHQIIKCYGLSVLLLMPFGAEASHHCSQWLAKVISFQGKVDIQFPESTTWESVMQDQTFCHGDKIRTARNSRATLLFTNESRATLDQQSTLTLLAPEKKVSSWYLKLLQGTSFFRSRQSQRLNIDTPFVNAVHEGTEFLVTVNSYQTEITVFDGQVAASNQKGEIHIKKGYTGIAKKNQPPHIQALTIRPEDAVQWTLYYPPVIDYQDSELSKLDLLQPAIKAYQLGDTYQALTLLDEIPATQQNASYLTLKSSLLLTVGSVDEAIKLIEKTLSIDADNSSAFALKSIIAVTKNRQDEALNLAQKAVILNPQSAVAQIALSYAYQSQFKIESALKATKEATRLSPDNALAWARLSELQLSTGERSDALASAKKAQQLNPKLDRTQTILGFAYLAQVDIDEAKTAFSKAINLNTADPLARLGLGLAKIRKGDVEESARDLETAVSLDPDNAIMRSYLGKAYYELKNDEFAGTELAIAKEMDPNDPTAWFYDAIRKQTTNRPVEALHDMEKAVALNDNRGVYRSRLLLDEDLAARSASLGRIYNDLGFQQSGLREGWKSVNADPSNFSAHRLLADNYSALSRHEIARVSELLQSQLLQPINVTPVQPQLAESNLLILDELGPAELSFNEFNPLFSRDRLALQTSGVYGSNNTWGDEVTHSGLWNNFSYSLGQFHFETDGFRENNDLEVDLYNIFLQAAITPQLNFQAEYRRQEKSLGDLALNFDPTDFEANKRENVEQDMYRIGARFSPASHSNIIFSGIYAKRNVRTSFDLNDITDENELFFLINSDNSDRRGYQIEAQYLFANEWLNLTAGGGSYRVDTNRRTEFGDGFVQPNDSNNKHYNGYFYSNFQLPSSILWTLGLSYDSFTSFEEDLERLNPKFGMQWNLADNLRVRLAYLHATRRPQAVDQTIEPTQIAGFNQFFDDDNSAETKRYGLGLDTTFADNLKGGIEFSRRDLKIRSFLSSSSEIVTDKRREYDLRGFLYWTPHNYWVLSIEAEYEKFIRSQEALSVTRGGKPSEVETFLIPLSAKYFHPSGFFGAIKGTFVSQNVDLAPSSTFNSDNDDFFLFDTSIGYRLPKRLGIISLGVKNLFNTSFYYQDRNAQTPTPTENPRFIPDRTIFFSATLSM